MQLLCFSYVLWPIHTINLQAISAMGRSDIFLKLEVIKKIIGVVALLISCPFGITMMLIMKIITSIISTFINAYPNKKLLEYTFKEQIKDILPYKFLSVIMASFSYLLKYFINNIIILLILQIFVGGIIYIIGSYLLKLDAFIYSINTIIERINKS